MDEVLIDGATDGGIRKTDCQNPQYAGCVWPNSRLTWVLSNKLVVIEEIIMNNVGERPAILIKQKSRANFYENMVNEEPHDHSVWHKHADTYQQKQARYWEQKVGRIMAQMADRRAA